MFKRPFFALLGLGAGVVLGVAAVRKAEEARQRLSPANIASAAGQRAGSLKERIDLALATGREAALAKEAELRSVYRVRAGQAEPGTGGPALDGPPPVRVGEG